MLTQTAINNYSISVIWAILCLLLFIMGCDVNIRLLFVLLFVYGYLVFNIIPSGVTSILVMFLSPMLHIEDTYYVSSVYFSTAGLALSTMFNGLMLQYSGLHERITLWLIIKIGCTPRRISCGLMVVSQLLSMWFSNIFTANIMIPVGLRLYEFTVKHHPKVNPSTHSKTWETWVNLGVDRVLKNDPTNLGTAYVYSIVLGAITGGLCFSRGSPTNITYSVVYAYRLNCVFRAEIWFFFTFPVTIILCVINYLWLQISFMGLFGLKWFEKEDLEEYEKILKTEKPIEAQYKKIGPVTWHEIAVGVLMISCFLLWVLREPFGYRGWQQVFTKYNIGDSTVTVFIAFLGMVIPANLKIFYSFSKSKYPKFYQYGLVTWMVHQKSANWGEFFFIGCINFLGIVQCRHKFGEYIASHFVFMKTWPFPIIIIVVSFFIVCLTEIVINPVLSSLATPTLIDMGILLNLHPMSISFICCLCTSLAMTNQFGSKLLRLISTVMHQKQATYFRAGLVPKISSYIILVTMYLTFGKATLYSKELQPGWYYSDDFCYCWPCGKNETRKI